MDIATAPRRHVASRHARAEAKRAAARDHGLIWLLFLLGMLGLLVWSAVVLGLVVLL